MSPNWIDLRQEPDTGIETLRAGIRWEFESFPQYMDLLERQGSALNIAAFAGQTTIAMQRPLGKKQESRRQPIIYDDHIDLGIRLLSLKSLFPVLAFAPRARL